MRIISEFHDYYDCVQAQGQDLTVVWNRKPEKVQYERQRFRNGSWKIEGEQYPLPILHGLWVHGGWLNVHQYVIGFCGKIYPFLRLTRISSQLEAKCHTIEDVDAFVVEHYDERAQHEYFRTKGLGKWWNRKHAGKRKDYLKFFEDCAQRRDRYEHLFREHHSPVFVGSVDRYGGEIEFNACLKDYEFYRVVDVYTAFQEIAMYYGGVLGGVREHIPEVSDKDMVEAKGFNKWSFRKEPTKK